MLTPRRFSLAAALLVSTFAAVPALAARTIVAPRAFWHDWAKTVQDPLPASPGVWMSGVDLVMTNNSNFNQTVTITARPLDFSFYTTDKTFSYNVYSNNIKVNCNGGAEQTTTTTLTCGAVMTPTGTASASATFNLFGLYRGEPTSNDPATLLQSWHIQGSFDITITVAEDRGAVSAIMYTRFENNLLSIPDIFYLGNMKSLAKVVPVNGGRPF